MEVEGMFYGSNLPNWLSHFSFSVDFGGFLTERQVDNFDRLRMLYKDDAEMGFISASMPEDYVRLLAAQANTHVLLPNHGISANNPEVAEEDSDAESDVSDLTESSGEDTVIALYENDEQQDVIQGALQGVMEELLLKFSMRQVGNVEELSSFPASNKAAEFAPHLTDNPSYKIAYSHFATQTDGTLVHIAAEVIDGVDWPRLCKFLPRGSEWGWGGGRRRGDGDVQFNEDDELRRIINRYPYECRLALYRTATYFTDEFRSKCLLLPGLRALPSVRVQSAFLASRATLHHQPYCLCEVSSGSELYQSNSLSTYALLFLQAFSHWTHVFTGFHLMFAGGYVQHDADGAFRVSAPVVYCSSELCYGRMNRGEEGFKDFYSRVHSECNEFCRALGVHNRRP